MNKMFLLPIHFICLYTGSTMRFLLIVLTAMTFIVGASLLAVVYAQKRLTCATPNNPKGPGCDHSYAEVLEVWKDKTPQEALQYVQGAAKFIEENGREAAYAAFEKEGGEWNHGDHLNRFTVFVFDCSIWNIVVYIVKPFNQIQLAGPVFKTLKDTNGRIVARAFCKNGQNSPTGSFTAMRGPWWLLEGESVFYWIVMMKVKGTQSEYVYTLLPVLLSSDPRDENYWETVEKKLNQQVLDGNF